MNWWSDSGPLVHFSENLEHEQHPRTGLPPKTLDWVVNPGPKPRMSLPSNWLQPLQGGGPPYPPLVQAGPRGDSGGSDGSAGLQGCPLGNHGNFLLHPADLRRIPAWAVDSLASDPRLPAVWWENDSFRMAAEALGHREPTEEDLHGVQLRQDLATSRRQWDAVAEHILARDFTEEPVDEAQVRSWEIGLRAADPTLAKRALAKLEVVEPARWRPGDLDAGRLLPRRIKAPR